MLPQSPERGLCLSLTHINEEKHILNHLGFFFFTELALIREPQRFCVHLQQLL